VVLVGGLAAVTARAEPIQPMAEWIIEIDPWPFPFGWPLIFRKSMNAGSIGWLWRDDNERLA